MVEVNKKEVEADVSWLGARLREPSTYAGLAVLLAAAHLTSDQDSLVHALTLIGTGVGGLIAILLPDPGSSK